MNRIEHPQNKSSTKNGLNLKWGYLVLSLAVLVKVIVLAVGQIPKTNFAFPHQILYEVKPCPCQAL